MVADLLNDEPQVVFEVLVGLAQQRVERLVDPLDGVGVEHVGRGHDISDPEKAVLGVVGQAHQVMVLQAFGALLEHRHRLVEYHRERDLRQVLADVFLEDHPDLGFVFRLAEDRKLGTGWTQGGVDRVRSERCVVVQHFGHDRVRDRLFLRGAIHL